MVLIKNLVYSALIIFSVLFVSGIAEAQVRQKSCPVFQITDGDEDSESADICGNGEGILFRSLSDLANNGGPIQLRLFFADISNPFSPVFFQLLAGDFSGYSINGDCTKITVTSRIDLTGENPGNDRQLYYGDISDPGNPIFTQLTNNTPDEFIAAPEISDDGTKITFRTRLNISGLNPNGDSTFYVFDANNNTNPFVALTNLVLLGSGTQGLVIDGDGSRVSFGSTANYNPPNQNPLERQQIFLSEISYNPPALPPNQLFQVTNNSIDLPAQEFGFLNISADGNTLAFMSILNLTGMNPGGINQVFIAGIDNPSSPKFYQITNVLGFNQIFDPLLNSSGDRIGFQTQAPEFNSGEDKENIVVADISDPQNPQFTIITDFPQDTDVRVPTASNDLSVIAFDLRDIDGDDTFQIYTVLNCSEPPIRSIPTLSEWGMIALAAALGVFGAFYAVRRRTVEDS